MTSYRHIVPNIYAEMCVKGEPSGLPTDVDFATGAPIVAAIKGPLTYEAPYTADAQLQHFESELVPLMSSQLVDALVDAGVSNMQLFRAEIANPSTGQRWTGYHAVNIIGLIACAAPSSSGEQVALRADGSTPLVIFSELIIDPARAGGALLFRLAESPGTILLAESVLNCLRKRSPAGGWNFTAYPVDDA